MTKCVNVLPDRFLFERKTLKLTIINFVREMNTILALSCRRYSIHQHNEENEDAIMESLSKRRFCQHGRLPEVNRAVIDGE